VKDLDLTIVVLAKETRRPRLSKDREGRKDVVCMAWVVGTPEEGS